MLHDVRLSVLPLQNSELSPGLPLGPKIGPYCTAIWNGQRYLLVNQDNGNVHHRGDSLAGQFVAANGTPEETTPGFGTWRAPSGGGDGVSHIAMGTAGQQTLVVWMHDQPEGVLKETSTNLPLDGKGNVIENTSFGDVSEQTYCKDANSGLAILTASRIMAQ